MRHLNLKWGRRDSLVTLAAVRADKVKTGGSVSYLTCTEECLRDHTAEELIEGDPEIDFEMVGRTIGTTRTVWVDEDGHTLTSEPTVIEVLTDTDGVEVQRRLRIDTPANVAGDIPVRPSGHRWSVADAVRRFVFRRTMQVRHVDGLQFDWLHSIAKDLHEEGVVLHLSASGGPLVFEHNGLPYQAFLSGRIDGDRYQLLLHLSDLELRGAP